MELDSLPEKELRVMIRKMPQELGEKYGCTEGEVVRSFESKRNCTKLSQKTADSCPFSRPLSFLACQRQLCSSGTIFPISNQSSLEFLLWLRGSEPD